jgi:hypothetical protein
MLFLLFLIMAKAIFVKSAQKPIYEIGKVVSYISKKGKRKGQTLEKIDKTQPANKKDKIFISKGESYWWWCLKIGFPKQYSKNKPKQSQLTLSNFMSTLYTIQENIEEFSADTCDDFKSFKDEILGEIESLKDETQSSFDNMPESLQSGDTGQLLEERINALDEWHNDIEQIETAPNL